MNTNLNKSKIYYWANSELNNDGEGILANNFLSLLKNKYKNASLISINKTKLNNNQNIFSKYILPFYGAILLWKYYFKNEKISYVNYLPAWNFLLIILLPPRTIIGPVTGSINRKNWNTFFKVLSFIGIKILLIKFKKIIFSHDFYKNYIPKNKIKYCFFNFLLFNFKKKNYKNKKKYDFIFYIRKHQNKGNKFTINLIKILTDKNYKVCVIGEKLNIKKNITYKGFLNRKNAMNLISISKYSLGSFENLFSFFVLDCLSNNLKVFVNKNFKINKTLIKTNLLIPIDFYNPNKSYKLIEKSIKNKSSVNLKYKQLNFNRFFD